MEGQYQTSSCLCTYPLQILQFLTQTASHCHHIADQKKKTLRIQSHPFCFLVWSKVFSLYAHIFLLLQLMIFVTQPVSSEDWDGVVITQADYQGLQAFKHQLVDTKGYLQSWNDSGYGACKGGWTGIKCVRGQVIVIHLPWKGLGGQITEEIAQLQALRKLSLHDNLLGGSIPAAFGFLPNLRGVQLFNNRLSGSIPPSLASCPLLQTLDLGNNLLTGTLPATLANCTKLLRLNVSFNSLSGSIPNSLTTLPSLAILALQNNLFSGSIPDSWYGTEGKTSFHLQSLTLDHNLFSGTIPASLAKLSKLQDLSLSHNEIGGTIPNDIGNLSMLRSLDFSNNAICGSLPTSLSNLLSLEVLNLEINHLENQIPETLDNLRMLLVINLGGNHFSGQIPVTVGNISMLTQLNLAHNNLTGEIPASLGDLPNLIFLDVSYNDFSGPIPTHLSQKFNSSSFMGNLQLCGYNASNPCPPMAPSQVIMAPFSEQSKNHHHKFSAKDKTLMAAGALLLVLLSLCCILLCCCIRERAASKAKDCQVGGGAGAMKGVSPVEGEGEEESGQMGGKLVHFNSLMVFTLEDLLSATAEIIGKSTYGTVYKVMLENGNQVAVKRLRNKFTVNQREFEKNVNVLGKIQHPNLLALRAYYWGLKGEKLLAFDYMPKGSLAAALHAARPDATVDWQTRIKIAQGMTRGLFHLHTHQNIIHGNLSSSNILLDEKNNAKVADFGLSLLMTTAANSNVIVTARALGYRAPELLKLKKANTKTDIYSLGVIILELLTGKAPSEVKNGVDLPQWVASYVKQEKTNEVFDSELTKDESTISDKLLSTLKLALQCVEPSASARPEAQHVLQQLEEIRPIKLPRPVIQNNIRSLI